MAKRIVDEDIRFNIVINGNQAQKELLELDQATRKLNETNQELRAERKRLRLAGKKDSEAYKKLSKEIDTNSLVISKNKARMIELKKQVGLSGLTMRQLSSEARRLRAVLGNMLPGSEDFKRYQAELKAVNARISQIRSQSRASEGTIKSVANSFNKYAALGASVLATLTGVVFSLQKAIDYSGKLADAQSDVRKTTGMTKEEVDELTKSFGLLQTRTSRINLLKIAEEGGRIGIPKEEIADFVDVMDKAVVALGDSFPGGAEETASKLGKLKLLFKETKDQDVGTAYNAIGSAINELGANGVATEINIANFATRVGSLPDALKPSIAEALALGAGFEESGIKAEIAGRAYGIVLKQAAGESEKFAKVMGRSTEEVEKLLNSNPLEFMIQFADGLQGMNATETAQTLEYLGVAADGANKVLGAISNSTQRFRELNDLSNRSMQEGTSLITEYNVKNNNFAATLDKVRKRINAIISGQGLQSFLQGVVGVFGKLIGAFEDAGEALDKEIKLTYESARANRLLASESQALLNRYEELTADGVEPTKEAKEELDIITLQLKDRLGESVMAIDKETGSYILNTEAVRQQIKLKRLAADEEAATLASRLVGVQEEIKVLELRRRDAEKEFDTRNKFFEEKNKQALADIRNSDAINAMEKESLIERLEGYSERSKAINRFAKISEELNDQLEREVELAEKLKELNFDLSDANAFINPTEGEGPKEGDKKTVGNTTFIYRNGQWVALKTFTPPEPDTPGSNKAKDNLNLLRQNLLLRNDLINDAFLKEMADLEINHKIKLKALEQQLNTEGKLTEDQIEANGLIREQMRLLEKTHQVKVATLTEKGIEQQLKDLQSGYQQEQITRQTAHNEALAALGSDQEARKKLNEDFQRQELEQQEAYVREVIRQFKLILDEENFGGFDLNLLTEEQKTALLSRLEELKLKLSEIANEKAKITGGGDEFDSLFAGEGNVDILGMNTSQWILLFDNLDTSKGKLEAVVGAVGALGNAWAMYNSFVSQNEQARLDEFTRNNQLQQERLERRLDNGVISQRQYNQAVEGLQTELEKRQAEAEYNQAKRSKESAMAGIVSDTARAIMGIWADFPKADFGATAAIASAAVGALGLVQLGMVAKQKLPARGFEGGYGYLDVIREQDGKPYRAAYGGESRSGLVDRPTVFLAGEGGKNFPELIISGPDFKAMNPRVVDAMRGELARVRGFEDGYYNETGPGAPKGFADDALSALLSQNLAVMKELRDKGVIAFISKDPKNLRRLEEEIESIKKSRRRAAINP